jgi:tetratricopeptide (TPR) repeat protein
MDLDRVREAEASVGLLPLPEVPPELSTVIADAGEALAGWGLDGNAAALQEFVRLMDECVMHPAFPGAGRQLRLRLLSRAGTAHNWSAGELGKPEEFDVAISLLGKAEALCTDADVDLPRVEYNISNVWLRRYQFGGPPADLREAEEAARRGLTRASAAMVHCLLQEEIAQILGIHFRLQGGLARINEAVERAEDALRSCREAPRRRLRHHAGLAQVLQYRYQATGILSDLERAIALLEEAERAPDKPWQLRCGSGRHQLGVLYRQRHSRTHAPQDIDAAVRLLSAGVAVETSPPGSLTNLGSALLDRYNAMGDDEDLRAALRLQEVAVRRTGAGDWQLASRYNNLGNTLSRAGQVWGDRDLTRAAISSYRAALALTDQDAQERASREFNLAVVLATVAGKRSRRLIREAVASYRAAIRDGLTGSLEWAHSAATSWGEWAVGREAWAEAAEAYCQALDIAQRLFREQLLRSQKETWLTQSQGVPDEAAYALVRLGRPQDAVRALESGRGLLISEILDRDRANLTDLNQVGRDDLVMAYQKAASALDLVMSPHGPLQTGGRAPECGSARPAIREL